MHLKLNKFSLGMFVGPCPHRDRNYCIGSNFWKFYLIKISFTLHELVSLVKVLLLLIIIVPFSIFFCIQILWSYSKSRSLLSTCLLRISEDTLKIIWLVRVHN